MTFINIIKWWLGLNLVGSAFVVARIAYVEWKNKKAWREFESRPKEDLLALALSDPECSAHWPATVTAMGYERARDFVVGNYLIKCQVDMIHEIYD